MELLARYRRKAQAIGLGAALRSGWEKATTRGGLEARSAWWSLRRARPVSDRLLLSRATDGWSSVAALVDHLRRKYSPAFLVDDGARHDYVATFRIRYPDAEASIRDRADAILRHEFHFLGHDYRFGSDIDWHQDPGTGRRWPLEYFERIETWMWSARRPGDNKLPWELNRHQYFGTLGLAFWLTGDERYAEEFARQVASWIAENPVGLGVNWFSALEIGIRLISWTLAYEFLRGSRAFEGIGGEFVKSVYQQAAFLRAHLTAEGDVRNNHIIGEAASLVVVGATFSDLRDASEWVRTGVKLLERELALQVGADGADKEQATSYHRFVADFLTLVVLLGQRGAIPGSASLAHVLERMATYVMYITTGDGTVPNLGDNDDGRGYVLSEGGNFWDFRETLAVATVLFGRGDFKFVAQGFPPGAFWLLGPAGLATFDLLAAEVPKKTSMAFPDAGQYVIRDGWGGHSDAALFKSGPYGWGGDGHCAHAHCDLLSFSLSLGGRPLIVDSGTFTYHGAERDTFRHTAAHNTIQIDGREQAEACGDFCWRRAPEAHCLAWGDDRVAGSLDGPAPVRLTRELRQLGNGRWTVTDQVSGSGRHTVEWFLHFAPDLTADLPAGRQGRVVLSRPGGGAAELRLPDALQPPFVGIHDGWVSPSYGVKQRNQVLRCRWEGDLDPGAPMRFSWTISGG